MFCCLPFQSLWRFKEDLGGVSADTPALDMAALQQPPAAAAVGASQAPLPHLSHSGRRCCYCCPNTPPLAPLLLHSCLTGMASRSAAPPCCCMAPWLPSWRPSGSGAPGLCSWTGLVARSIAHLARPVGQHGPVPGLLAQAPGPHPAHAEVVSEPHQLQPDHGLSAGQELRHSPRQPPAASLPELQLSTPPAGHALPAQEQPLHA